MAGPATSRRKRKTKASGVDDMLAGAFGMNPDDEQEVEADQEESNSPRLPPSGPPPKTDDSTENPPSSFKPPTAGPPSDTSSGPPGPPPGGPPKSPPSNPPTPSPEESEQEQADEEETETESPKAPPAGPPSGPPKGMGSSPPSAPINGPPTGPKSGPPSGPLEGPPTGPSSGPPTGPSSGPPSAPPPTAEDEAADTADPPEEETPPEAEEDEADRPVKQPVEDEGPIVAIPDSITAYVNPDEVEKLQNEVSRLRDGLSSAAEIITDIEDTPMPPIVGPDYVVSSHIVADFVRLGRLLQREGLVRAGQGSVSILDPDEPGLVHASRSGCMFARMTEHDIITGRLGQKAPEAAPVDWRVHEVLLAFASLQNEGPAACIHAISPHAIALSLDKDIVVMEPIDEKGKESFGKAVIVDSDFNDMDEYLRQLTDAMRQGNGKAICVRGVGIYSVGRTFDEAWDNAAIIEHSCEITLLTRRAGIELKKKK